MMGTHDTQGSLFYVGLDLEDRIPADHPLRLIRQKIDFSFVRQEVADFYGHNGHVSVDPVVIVKLLLLLFLDDVKSERELIRQVSYRMDYLWFLGFSLDQTIPNHSVLSKARSRWGVKVFERIFVYAVQQCVEAGLVDGAKLHMDSTLINANASKDSVIKGSPELITTLRKLYVDQEMKLEDVQKEKNMLRNDTDPSQDQGPNRVNAKMFSTTDPEAAIVRANKRDPRPRYKHHRSVDDAHGVITAVETTPGDIDESHRLIPLVDQHEKNTNCSVQTVVADSKYGTIENHLACDERGICPHMSDLQNKQKTDRRRANIFPVSAFHYDPVDDTYKCPAGQTMRPRRLHRERQSWDYLADKGVCNACSLREQCTKGKQGRSIKRHWEQDRIDLARRKSASAQGKKDRRRRQYLMEGSFAQGANCHHLKRSHWRGLWRQRIQDLMIASVQNIKILMRTNGGKPRTAVAMAVSVLRQSLFSVSIRYRCVMKAIFTKTAFITA